MPEGAPTVLAEEKNHLPGDIPPHQVPIDPPNTIIKIKGEVIQKHIFPNMGDFADFECIDYHSRTFNLL